jgi:dephospho-CoA kinase
VPLLFEEKLARSFDLIIFIKADINKRKERVLKRGVSKEYFNLMNKKQFNENTKSNLSDFTIQNNGSILNLRLNIIKLLNL